MARKLRLQYVGAIYHVMSRGDRAEDILRGDPDREAFLHTLGQACEKTDWQIHAWRLMRNHFHPVVETPKPNLVTGMKWFLGTHNGRFNRRHRLFGHPFSGRYKALYVDGSGDAAAGRGRFAQARRDRCNAGNFADGTIPDCTFTPARSRLFPCWPTSVLPPSTASRRIRPKWR
ncbi:MAG: transposase [Limisphaerales bacterium]